MKLNLEELERYSYINCQLEVNRAVVHATEEAEDAQTDEAEKHFAELAERIQSLLSILGEIQTACRRSSNDNAELLGDALSDLPDVNVKWLEQPDFDFNELDDAIAVANRFVICRPWDLDDPEANSLFNQLEDAKYRIESLEK